MAGINSLIPYIQKIISNNYLGGDGVGRFNIPNIISRLTVKEKKKLIPSRRNSVLILSPILQSNVWSHFFNKVMNLDATESENIKKLTNLARALYVDASVLSDMTDQYYRLSFVANMTKLLKQLRSEPDPVSLILTYRTGNSYDIIHVEVSQKINIKHNDYTKTFLEYQDDKYTVYSDLVYDVYDVYTEASNYIADLMKKPRKCLIHVYAARWADVEFMDGFFELTDIPLVMKSAKDRKLYNDFKNTTTQFKESRAKLRKYSYKVLNTKVGQKEVDTLQKLREKLRTMIQPIQKLRAEEFGNNLKNILDEHGTKLKATSDKLHTVHGIRIVYVGPNGGKYVKILGKYVNINHLS